MHTLLLIPDGIGIRNFVLGQSLAQLRARGDVTVLHGIPDPAVPRYRKLTGEDVRWETLSPHRETVRTFLLRYTLWYAHMYHFNTMGMRLMLDMPPRGTLKSRLAHRLTRALARISATTGGIQRLERWHCDAVRRLPETERYRQLLRQLKPSILFCSHQRPPTILPAVLAARELGIPTVTFIFSWDNLTSKGRIAAPFDHYFVWSALMKDELLRFYPEVPPERIHIVGSPQFDPYADPALLWTREEFFRRVGADIQRPLICYSANTFGFSPDDPAYLDVLLNHVKSGRIKGRPQVLVRTAPPDPGDHFNAVLKRYPDAILCKPDWYRPPGCDWQQVIATPEDVQFLTNLTFHADLNVNLASTMTLDFAIRDKPVVNIAFDVTDPPRWGAPMWEYFYRFEHYAEIVKLGAARFAKTADELAEHVNSYMDDRALERAERRKLVDLEVGAPIGTAGALVASTLEQLQRPFSA